MSWTALANNQWVSREDLQDAVDTSVFVETGGIPTPTPSRWMTKEEIEDAVDATVTSSTDTQWPQKSWIIPNTTTTTTTSTTSSTTTTTTTVATTTTSTSTTTSSTTTTTTTLPPTTTSTTSTTTSTSTSTTTSTTSSTTTSTTTIATTTTSTTTSSTTTTTTTGVFIVNIYNEGTQVNINEVHGIGGYVSGIPVPITPGNTETDNNWPTANWGTSSGMYVIRNTAGSAYYHIDVYVNTVITHQENSNTTVGDAFQYHFSFGVASPGAPGTTVDVYLRDGQI